MVPMYNIATVRLHADGEFDVQLPDFSKAPDTRNGSFQLTVREHKTWNTIADLVPADAESRWKSAQELDARSSYPATVEFIAKKRD
jgi:hypothetical protein